jgi:hypothetical protein
MIIASIDTSFDTVNAPNSPYMNTADPNTYSIPALCLLYRLYKVNRKNEKRSIRNETIEKKKIIARAIERINALRKMI